MTTGPSALGMRRVNLAHKTLAAYAPIVGDEAIAEIETLAKPLQGARVAHVSATAHGGGVAELLHTLVPLMRGAGLDAEWHVISGSEEFFTVTKGIHNALQGMPLALSTQMRAIYLETNRENAASFESGFDFVVVHDPQPAPLRALRPHDSGKWIWRCHIDLTSASPVYWDFMRPFLREYDAAIFTMPEFALPDLRVGTIAIIPPAIDPLSPKNVPMPAEHVKTLVEARHVDASRPILLQASRFDPWKDPIGVIDVYRAVRQEIPGVQLVLLGVMALDDPEGEDYYRRTVAYAGDDPDIHVLINQHGGPEVNAFQRGAAVIVQKSLREGFGLTVTEGLWKARPVVGSNVGGIPLQIEDSMTGYLVESVAQAAARVMTLLRDPALGAEIGARGREVVRHRFLSPANLRNYLQLLNALSQAGMRQPQTLSQ